MVEFLLALVEKKIISTDSGCDHAIMRADSCIKHVLNDLTGFCWYSPLVIVISDGSHIGSGVG